MGKCKTKAIQTDLGTFRHNQSYPGIIQAYSSICKTLCNPGIFGSVVYPELWHIQNKKHNYNPDTFITLYIQNPRILRKLAYSKSEAYSEPCQTSTMKHSAKKINGSNHFCKWILFLYYKLVALYNSWNKYHEVVTPEVVILR